MTDIEQVLSRVRSNAEGRTRYEGQTPYDDEVMMAEIMRLRQENAKLRDIISQSTSAIGNGAFASPDCSIEFMAGVPKEIALCTSALRQELAEAREAIEQVEQWIEAYPLTVFPEPDFAKARELLEAGGITLDSISASNMRHVLNGVAAIVRPAIRALDAGKEG